MFVYSRRSGSTWCALVENSTEVTAPVYYSYVNNETGALRGKMYNLGTMNVDNLPMMRCVQSQSTPCRSVFTNTMPAVPALHSFVSIPLLDAFDNQIGSIFTSTSLTQLSNAMDRLLANNTVQHRAFVIDADGMLVSSTHGPTLLCEQGNSQYMMPSNCLRYSALNSTDDVVAASGRVIADADAASPGSPALPCVLFKAADGSSYRLTMQLLVLSDTTTWRVCVVSTDIVASRTFVAATNQMLMSSMWLLPCSLLLTIFVSFIVSAPLATALRTQQSLSEANRELEATRRTAAEAAANRFRFLANMSHELRTPLQGLMGGLQLLFDSPLVTASDRAQQAVIQDCTDDLVRMLNSILDLYKMEHSGMLVLAETDLFRVDDAFEHVLNLFSRTLDDKGIEAVLDSDADVEFMAQGDVTRFRQIFSNLISNASKFTGARGCVILSFQVESLPAGRENSVFGPLEWPALRVSAVVEDSGVGIPKNFQHNMFNPCVQADESESRAADGTGIGLRIVKHLVTAMKGNVQIASRENVGTAATAQVILKRGPPVEPVVLPPLHLSGIGGNLSSGNALGGRRRVLVLMRVRRTAAVVRSRLAASYGIEADCFVSVPMAVNALTTSEEGYAAVVIDDRLADELRAHATECALASVASHHVVWLLEQPVSHMMAAMALTSADPVVMKPLVVRQLGKLLARLLDTPPAAERTLVHHLFGHVAAAAAAANQRLPPGAELVLNDAPLFGGENGNGGNSNSEPPLVLLVEDNPVLQKVMAGMLYRERCRVELASNGREAVTAIERGGFEKYALVVMDLQMPIMDGFAAAATLRRMEALDGGDSSNGGNSASSNGEKRKRLPIVALSALSAETMRADQARTHHDDMDGHLSKPVTRADLVAVLSRFIPTGEKSD